MADPTPGSFDLLADPGRFLREARERVHAFHRGTDRWGSRTTHLYTAVVDNTLRGLYRQLRRDSDLDPEWLRDRFCLVATGGYARKALSPWSDVDVMLLSADPSDPELQEVGRRILYPLWDAGLQVGQRPGTIEQILASAEEDIAGKTALLDLRHIGGSRALYDRVHARVDDAMERWRPELLARVRPENLARFDRYGQSVFLLEPNVKEGKGGLRDWHWLGWIMKLRAGLRGDYDLLLSGLVEPEHYRQLMAAHEFLLRVRVQLHLGAGRAEDRLLFESQEPVAKALGFKKGRGLLAVEHFMGTYYRHAYAMAHFCGLYVARTLGFYWDESEIDDQPTVRLELGPSAPVARAHSGATEAVPEGPFELQDGTVRCVRPDELGEEPALILGLFEFLQEVGGRLHHDTLEHVRAVLGRVNKRFRTDPDIGRRFRAILEGPSVFRTLVAMHRSGFLGSYIPEFGACFCQAQHNRVHLYTVDVHCLYVVRELEALASPEASEAAPIFARAWTERTERAPLILAGLLHDIAKSHGAAHSRVGADQAGVVLGRLGCTEAETARVQWLVRHHLVLSETAYHRDIYDPKTLQDLVAVVPDREHLEDLVALTWADSRATNPVLLTSWKQALLKQAYSAALGAIAPGELGDSRPAADVARAKVEALLMSEVGRKAAGPLAARVLEGDGALPGYLERTPPALLATHAILLDQLDAASEHVGGRPIVTHVRQLADSGVSQWLVCTRDRPGVFSRLAGALTASGMSIRAAEALTRADGLCIDTFAVSDQFGRRIADTGPWRRLERLVRRVDAGELDLDEAIDRARRTARPAPDPGSTGLARITVSDELSETATVVEVVTPDRPALVYDITHVLFEFGLDLRVAKIATRQDLASDTFYVVNRRGQPIGRRRRRQLAAILRDRFGEGAPWTGPSTR